MNCRDNLISNIDKVHTTDLGVIRIKKNLSLEVDDVVSWCIGKIKDSNSVISKRGKNFYVDIDNSTITINSHSYTIITAHKIKSR